MSNHTCQVKTCTKCGVTQPIAAFHAHAGGKDGRHPQCRECRKADSKARYRADPKKHSDARRARFDPSKHRIYNQNSRGRLRKLVLAAYGGVKPMCECCAEADTRFLTIDHTNGGGQQHRKEIGSALYAWLKKNGYPPGFRLLCFNCNCARAIYGTCPHQDPRHADQA